MWVGAMLAATRLKKLGGTIRAASQNRIPQIDEYLKQQFQKVDFDKEGHIDAQFFWLMVKKLHLKLDAHTIALLKEALRGALGEDEESFASMNMRLEHFTLLPKLIQAILTGLGGPSKDDWCELPIKVVEGKKPVKKRLNFWFNKRTLVMQREKPEMDRSNEPCPTLLDYLKMEFKKSDSHGQGELSMPEFQRMLAHLYLNLQDDQSVKLAAAVNVNKDGNVSVHDLQVRMHPPCTSCQGVRRATHHALARSRSRPPARAQQPLTTDTRARPHGRNASAHPARRATYRCCRRSWWLCTPR